MLRACERQGTGDKYNRERAEREQECDMEVPFSWGWWLELGVT